ncbi:MAG TPA: MerR family transcriptional regulator [Polyangiaceae bacterium]|nr:MerR family transcriptional regulator [Polyangiaceae bacterium]
MRRPLETAAAPDVAAQSPADRMPIEELSRRTGVTVRNLRELQRRALLEPPLLEGRKGFYTERHVARVTLVRTLQDRGYSLTSIADLLARWKGSLGTLGMMNVEDGVATPGFDSERSLDHEQILQLLPELVDDAAALEQLQSLELVRTDAEGRLFAPNSQLLETARALADLGVPFDVQLADFRTLLDEVAVMTARFRARFHEHVVTKLQREGMPAGGMEDLANRLAHVRPAVVRSVAIVLSSALARGGPLTPAAPATPPQRPRSR